MLHTILAHSRLMSNNEITYRKNAAKLAIVLEKKRVYTTFIQDMQLALSTNNFTELAVVLNTYMDYAKAYEFEPGSIYKTRTKYYSSILEEFPVHVVQATLEAYIKANVVFQTTDFYLGSYPCVVRLGVKPAGGYYEELKMIDFALAIQTDGLTGKVFTPLLGLEVKRYLDKTMFHTIEHTRRVLSEFRPRTYYGLLIEDECRAPNVVQNSTMFNREFVLTGKNRARDDTRNPICCNQLMKLVTDIRGAAIHAADSIFL